MNPTAAEAAVVIQNLRKVYRPSPTWMRALMRSRISQPIVALDSISFAVNPGEICAVVGPNGAGKSTTFRILVGLTTPTSGSATVLGFDAEHDSMEIRRRVGWMPTEERSLHMTLNCYDNLDFHGRLQGLKKSRLDARIREVLEVVGLQRQIKDSVFSLSAGMKARLQLARALLHEPEVLILDEPTASVDPVGSYELLATIISLVEEHKLGALISSHRLDEIEALHSKVVLLDQGRVAYDGDLDSLRLQLDRPHFELVFTDSLIAQRAEAALQAFPGAELVRRVSETVRYVSAGSMPIGTTLEHLDQWLANVVSVKQVNVPLRDLLAEMYGVAGSE